MHEHVILPPPPLAGYAWRPLRLGDAMALAALAAACAPVDGNPEPPDTEGYAARLAAAGATLVTDTLCAAGAAGALAAYAWAFFDHSSPHECRVYLEARVHPDFRGRGLGGFLLNWLEARGRAGPAAAGEIPDARPTVLRIDTSDEYNPAATALYEARGFHLAVVEEDLRRDLGPATQPLPTCALPETARLVEWSAETAGAFYRTYVDAFRERPGFPGLSQEQWQARFTGYPAFRPDLSWLLLDGDEPVAYTLCAIEAAEGRPEMREGWIVQIGVRPAWRRRGFAGLLLARGLHDFAAEGLPYAMLSVNLNNPTAASLYQRLGFVRTRRVASYRK